MSRPTIETVRRDFPLLALTSHGKPLAYLDNAATTQKPRAVLDKEREFYETMNANVHRGMYELSERATDAYEAVREQIRQFLHARKREEIVFTKNATEAINLVAATWARARLKKGDVVLLTEMEHHSNIVPWQQLAQTAGAELLYVPVTDEGLLDRPAFRSLLERKPAIVAVTAFSNVLGTVNPVKELVREAHRAGAVVLVDAAQAAAHVPIDVASWDCDFLAFSAHKMYGPTGVGVLYGKEALLRASPPFLYGGDMILEVHKDSSTWNELPWKFEAGTMNSAGIVAFGAALDYLEGLSWDWIREREAMLSAHLHQTLSAIDGVRVYGPTDLSLRGGVCSFAVDALHPHDIATIFDGEGIAVRSGHHCAQVLMERLGVPALARASLAFYNTTEEIDRIPGAIAQARKILRVPT